MHSRDWLSSEILMVVSHDYSSLLSHLISYGGKLKMFKNVFRKIIQGKMPLISRF
jgi:hypothetical protein